MIQGRGISDRVREILSDLERLRETLLALSDDIWLNIDHNDQEALKAGFEFKTEYNEQLTTFDQLSEEISQLVQRFTTVDLEPQAAGDATHRSREEHDRIVRELDRTEPHVLGEDFSYKRPYGYRLVDTAHKDVVTWRRLYELVCRQLASKNPELFRGLPYREEFTSNRGNTAFATEPSRLRRSRDIGCGIYADVNLSANHICNNIAQLLLIFGIDQNELLIFLREDRDADRMQLAE